MRVLPARFNNKPQYVFHPTRAVRRALRGRSRAHSNGTPEVARLPWGLPLEVYRSDAIGFSILSGRVFDPCVSETLHRLIDPGDVVVDVGANVGYLTSLAATRAGATGSVIAFEPHPTVFELLASNVARWGEHPDVAPIEIHQAALSDHVGVGELTSGPMFSENMGLAALSSSAPVTAETELLPVSVRRLDDVLEGRPVGVLKVDVEGHEPAVLRGARALLEGGLVRDVVFEDHEDYPSAATEIVEGAGYRLLSLDNDLFGLRLCSPQERGATAAWPGPSYLATREPERALSRLQPRGWRISAIGPRLPWPAR